MKIIVYFEAVSISSLLWQFPMCSIRGRNFQFKQCLWQKVQHLGLVPQYTNDEVVRFQIRICSALAMIPMEDIDDE